MELDHIFICVQDAASEAERLREFGLTEGAANEHPGQGTANRRFFFRNAFFELLYLTNDVDCRSPLTKPTMLHKRLAGRSRGVSPFGICFRPSSGDKGSETPFPGWKYKPQYLPSHLQVDIGHAPVSEPMWFFLAFGLSPGRASVDRQQPMTHRTGFSEITSIRITVPDMLDPSDPACCASKLDEIELVDGDDHLLSLSFDDESSGESFDFRPALPLVFRW